MAEPVDQAGSIPPADEQQFWQDLRLSHPDRVLRVIGLIWFPRSGVGTEPWDARRPGARPRRAAERRGAPAVPTPERGNEDSRPGPVASLSKSNPISGVPVILSGGSKPLI